MLWRTAGFETRYVAVWEYRFRPRPLPEALSSERRRTDPKVWRCCRRAAGVRSAVGAESEKSVGDGAVRFSV